MRIIDNIKNIFTKSISLSDYETLMSYFGEYWKLTGKQHTGYVAACLNTMGNYFAKANFRIYEKDKDKLIEIFDHPFSKMLETPNNFQVENELKHYIGEFFGVFGNFYLRKDRGQVSKKVRRFSILDPRQVTPVPSSSGLAYYKLQTGMSTEKIPIEEVIHLKYLSANSLYRGVALIKSIEDVLDIDAFQTAYMKEFYENGGFLGQVFTTDQNLRPAEFNRVKSELKAEYAGEKKSHKMALFTGGMKPVKSAYSLKDMEMSASRKLTLSEVMTAFRIPQILLGGEGGTYNKATAQTAEYTYAATMIEPALNYIDQVFTKHLRIDYKDESLVCKHDPVSPKDVEENLKYYKDMTSVGGLVLNDIRRSENYDPFPYELAEIPLLNVGGAVIRLDTGEQLGTVPNNKINEEPKDEEPKSAESRVEKSALDLHWRQANRRIDDGVKFIKRRVDEFFDDQKERLLKTLDLKSPLAETFFDSLDEIVIINNLIENAWMRMFERGMEFSGKVNLNDPRVRSLLQQMLNQSTSINQTSKDKINKILNEGGDLRQKIENQFNEFKNNRSPLISETTGVAGFNAGLWLGYKSQGMTHKTWISQRDDRVRESHILADGQRVKIDEPFTVGGSFLMFPSDPTSFDAEETVNCRCVIIADKGE